MHQVNNAQYYSNHVISFILNLIVGRVPLTRILRTCHWRGWKFHASLVYTSRVPILTGDLYTINVPTHGPKMGPINLYFVLENLQMKAQLLAYLQIMKFFKIFQQKRGLSFQKFANKDFPTKSTYQWQLLGLIFFLK